MSENPGFIVDLRSDTVTRPTAAMREAMMNAVLGDDVLGDDPTVAELEAVSAEMLGKEAGLFVPSGTMGNQIALACHTQPGDVVIMEEEAHIFYYEVGAPAMLAQVLTRTLPSKLGAIDPDDIRRAITKKNLHTPGATLLAVENTHNRAGGTIVPLELIREYRKICDEHGLALHLDGARVFNAAVALGVHVREAVQDFDSVSFCLSKGLGSPVGSVLVGTKAFIEKARYWRKRLGGGMRQSGLLAACGLVSLRTMVDRLADDHNRARRFAEGVNGLPGLSVNWETVQTNMVLVETTFEAQKLLDKLSNFGVWAMAPAVNRIRFVFHADVTEDMLEHALFAMREATTKS